MQENGARGVKTLLSKARVFDGVSPQLSEPSFITVVDGKFEAIDATRPKGRFDCEVDLAGRTLMPGLIDAHFHAFATETDTAKCERYPQTYEAQRARLNLEAALLRGFTTIRDVGGGDHGTWLAAEQGLFPSPRIFFCGRAFSQSGGHGDARAPYESSDLCGCAPRGALSDLLDGVDALRKASREALRQGAHHLKIFMSGGISTPSDPIWYLQFSDDEIAAVVDEARRRRRYVAAHAYTADSIMRAVNLGVRSIEHGNLIDLPTARAVAAAGAFVVPTLVTYDALYRFGNDAGAPSHSLEKLAEVRERGFDAIRICRSAGVRLGFGTDLLGSLHAYQRDEFHLRARVEAAPDILRSATSINASLLDMEGKLGVISPGAFADFLIVDGDPLKDITLLATGSEGISQIWSRGRKVR
ncbi:metal-dependent hydrolase family protein [Sphingomonas crocodyli]|nr:amidohydrolase family protein [Sphingomonas crocodyli]